MKIRATAIIIFWLVMTGWLVRYEAFPEWFSTPSFGYQALMKGGPFVVDSWMQVLFKETPIGYSHTWVDTSVESPDESYAMNNITFLNLKIMGVSQWVEMCAIQTEDEGIARIQLNIHRETGEVSAWRRLNKGFLTDIRKQFLVWRTIPENVKLRYAQEGRDHLAALAGEAAESAHT